MTEDEIPLTGGTITSIVRVGDSVRRSTGSWSPAVHALLQHLEAVGFDGAPRVLGVDTQGREMLSYFAGDAGFHSRARVHPPSLWSDAVLVDAGRLLRLFHDATQGWIPPAQAHWQMVYPDTAQHEVICHNDFAPYNAIFAAGRLYAMIDFDMAGPGPRVWDVAYAAYRFVPLYADAHCVQVGLTTAPDRARRLRLLCDAYSLMERRALIETIVRRVQAIERMFIDRAAAGDAQFQSLIAEGHLEGYSSDLAYLAQEGQSLQTALDDKSQKT